MPAGQSQTPAWKRRFQGDNLRHNLELVETLKKLATAENCTPAQLAFAWVLSRAPFIVPIPGH
jgi:aryl-alcohol dehydrogenase-like predicted oxidoreductase